MHTPSLKRWYESLHNSPKHRASKPTKPIVLAAKAPKPSRKKRKLWRSLEKNVQQIEKINTQIDHLKAS